jgi:hypothetical protein
VAEEGALVGAVVQFRPSDAEIEEAWQAFDAAQQEANRVAADPTSSSHDRFKASIAAISLHRRFYRLCVRAGVGA